MEPAHRWLAMFGLGVSLLLGGCADLVEDSSPPPAPPAQSYTVDPVRNRQNIQVRYNMSFNYNVKDEETIRSDTPGLMQDRLNADGAADGNTFTLANGETPNLIINITFSNDGNDHYTAYAKVVAFADNQYYNVSSGPEPYVDAVTMVNALADNIYSFLHDGFHYP